MRIQSSATNYSRPVALWKLIEQTQHFIYRLYAQKQNIVEIVDILKTSLII